MEESARESLLNSQYNGKIPLKQPVYCRDSYSQGLKFLLKQSVANPILPVLYGYGLCKGISTPNSQPKIRYRKPSKLGTVRIFW